MRTTNEVIRLWWLGIGNKYCGEDIQTLFSGYDVCKIWSASAKEMVTVEKLMRCSKTAARPTSLNERLPGAR